MLNQPNAAKYQGSILMRFNVGDNVWHRENKQYATVVAFRGEFVDVRLHSTGSIVDWYVMNTIFSSTSTNKQVSIRLTTKVLF